MFRRNPPALMPPTVIVAPIWRRKPWSTTAVIVIVILALFGRSSASHSDDRLKYHDRVFTVVHVSDGDTFDIDIPDGEFPDTRIRLWGVDTPEVAGSRDGAMYFGAEASAFAKETLMGTRVRVRLAPERTRDKYRRLLAYVTLEDSGASYGEMLLERGLAYADWRFPHPLKTEYKQIERNARRNREGMWANVTRDQMPQWRRRMETELDYTAP